MLEKRGKGRRSEQEIGSNMHHFLGEQTGYVEGHFHVSLEEIGFDRDKKHGGLTLHLSMVNQRESLETYPFKIVRLTESIDRESKKYGGKPQFNKWRLVREETSKRPLYYAQKYLFH